MANIYDLADTWNAGGTTFTAIKMNVTDTASAAASLLMDLQVGAASRFSVTKNGAAQIFPASNGSTLLTTRFGFCYFGGASPGDTATSGFTLDSSNTEFKGRSTAKIGFTSSASNGNAALDTYLTRDAAGTLAQRNGTNAQAFHLYNTYTDASNYERGFMRWVANVLEIGTEKAGTGTLRDLKLFTSGAQRMTLNSDNSVLYSKFRVTGGANDHFLANGTAGWLASMGTNTSSSGVTFGVKTATQFAATATGQFVWTAVNQGGDQASAMVDTGIARSAAGVAKITDGSTGTGQLIFIVPTSDPGITGALWNNAGTLAISA